MLAQSLLHSWFSFVCCIVYTKDIAPRNVSGTNIQGAVYNFSKAYESASYSKSHIRQTVQNIPTYFATYLVVKILVTRKGFFSLLYQNALQLWFSSSFLRDRFLFTARCSFIPTGRISVDVAREIPKSRVPSGDCVVSGVLPGCFST